MSSSLARLSTFETVFQKQGQLSAMFCSLNPRLFGRRISPDNRSFSWPPLNEFTLERRCNKYIIKDVSEWLSKNRNGGSVSSGQEAQLGP